MQTEMRISMQREAVAHLTAMDMTMKCPHSSIKNLPLCLTTRLKEQRRKAYLADLNEQAEAMFSRLVKQLFEKRGRNGSPQSGKSNAVGAEDEQHP